MQQGLELQLVLPSGRPGTSYSGAAVGGTLKAAEQIDLFLNGLLLANMVFSYTLAMAWILINKQLFEYNKRIIIISNIWFIASTQWVKLQGAATVCLCGWVAPTSGVVNHTVQLGVERVAPPLWQLRQKKQSWHKKTRPHLNLSLTTTEKD